MAVPTIEIEYDEIKKSKDEDIINLVNEIELNLNMGDDFDPELDQQLMEQLAKMLEEKLEKIMQEQGLTAEQIAEEIDIEQIINYDVPEEIAQDIDSLALEDAYTISMDDLKKNISGAEIDKSPEENIHDKILSVSINKKDKQMDLLEELEIKERER